MSTDEMRTMQRENLHAKCCCVGCAFVGVKNRQEQKLSKQHNQHTDIFGRNKITAKPICLTCSPWDFFLASCVGSDFWSAVGQGSFILKPIWGGIKQYKWMVIFRDFPKFIMHEVWVGNIMAPVGGFCCW